MSDIGISNLGPTEVDTSFRSESLANLDKDAFLELLVAQMKYQNPMNPSDSNEYLAQAAQYASVEQLENMASSQQQLYSMQLVSVATDLVGKEVTAIDPITGGEVTGLVEVVRFGAEPILVVDGYEVGLTNVVDVRATPSSDPDPSTGDAAPGESADDVESPIDASTDAAETPADTEPAAGHTPAAA